jgi:hypothetical protein
MVRSVAKPIAAGVLFAAMLEVMREAAASASPARDAGRRAVDQTRTERR